MDNTLEQYLAYNQCLDRLTTIMVLKAQSDGLEFKS